MNNQALANLFSSVKYSEINRRSFLKGALAVGGMLALAGCGNNEKPAESSAATATATAPSVPAADEVESVIKVPSYILPDYASCVGCAICSIECSINHYGVADMEKTNIRVYGVNVKGGMIDVPILCMKCNDTPCKAACPSNVDAIYVDEKTFAVMIDKEKCIGCGNCIEACNEQRTGCLRFSNDGSEVVGMCDFCGGNPACVTYCPENVLQLLAKVHPVINHARKPRSIAEDVYKVLYSVN